VATLPANLPGDVAKILAVANSTAGQGWERLALWVDTYGSRLSGSSQLEAALDGALAMMSQAGFHNVHSEAASIPKWVRGSESLTMVAPYERKLAFLGLGTSIGTGGKPLTADILVVHSYDELKAKAADAKGKIVVYNQQCDWVANPDGCYGITATYRVDGPSEAAKVGAVAALVRSLTPESLNTPHTGVQHYESEATQYVTPLSELLANLD
jgi:carboxypeptidase Q